MIQQYEEFFEPELFCELKSLAPESWWIKNPPIALIHAFENWGKFDSASYRAHYPEVDKLEMDPLYHFVHFGIKECKKLYKKLESGNEQLQGNHYEEDPDIKVSVIVPVFNNAEFLKECFSSLINQTSQKLEFLIIDDGSTDDRALEIMDDFEKSDKRFRIIHKHNEGYGKAMNIGLDLAKGKYIGIVESDDFVEKNMFSELYALASEKNADIARSSFFKFSGIGKKNIETNIIADEKIYKRPFTLQSYPILMRLAPAIWSALYKRRFLLENQIRFTESPGASFQDTAFHIKTLFSAKRIILVKKSYYHYRIDNPGSSVKSNTKIFCIKDEFDEAQNFLTRNGLLKNKKLLNIFIYDRYRKYKWNYERLSENSQDKFFNEFLESVKAVQANPHLMEDERIFVKSFLEKNNEYAAKLTNTDGVVTLTPAISVIIPFYNSEKFIERTLNEITSQSLADIEIICIDDGSTDQSHKIVEKWIGKDKRITLLHQENLGAGAARNRGLEKAKGKYLYFADSDDQFAPTVLQELYDYAETKALDIAICRVQFLMQMTGEYRSCSHSIRPPIASLLQPFVPATCGRNIFVNIIGWAFDKLIRKELVDRYKIHFQEIRLHNDLVFVYSVLAVAKRIGILDRKLITKHQGREGQISSSVSLYWPCVFDALNGLRQNLKYYNIYNTYKRSYINYCVHLLAYYDSLLNDTQHYDAFLRKKKFFVENTLNLLNFNPNFFDNVKELKSVVPEIVNHV